jgi:hypothetical protein
MLPPSPEKNYTAIVREMKVLSLRPLLGNVAFSLPGVMSSSEVRRLLLTEYPTANSSICAHE